jgi:hypothetical protein
LPQEKWKIKEDFPSYSISNYGRIKNDKTNRILSPSLTSGYYKVRLSNNGETKDFMVHLLVFELFHSEEEIPKNYKIDHIDGNKLNNHSDNLRCISNADNALAALYETNTNSSIKPINQYTKEGEFIQSFRSIREAGRKLNLDSSSITKVCKGKVKTCGGFVFKYK